MNELTESNWIYLVGDKLHEAAVTQNDEKYFWLGGGHVGTQFGAGCCRVDAEINFYALARVAIEYLESKGIRFD